MSKKKVYPDPEALHERRQKVAEAVDETLPAEEWLDGLVQRGEAYAWDERGERCYALPDQPVESKAQAAARKRWENEKT